VEAQAANIAKMNGFANLDEYDDAWINISMIMSGIDPQTKKFTEPHLAQLEAELKNTKPVQFKENIALVLKYFDKLAPLMEEQNLNLGPAD
jgi:hypothetical protein